MGSSEKSELDQSANQITDSTEPDLSTFNVLTLNEHLEELPANNQLTTARELCLNMFCKWTETEQINFVNQVLDHLNDFQRAEIHQHLSVLTKRDIISLLSKNGMDYVGETILSYLDAASLQAAKLVCKKWMRVIDEANLLKKWLERKVHTDSLWYKVFKRRDWIQYFKLEPGKTQLPLSFFRMYLTVKNDIETLHENWRQNKPKVKRIICNSSVRGVYCLQYDDTKIIAGLRDNSIKIWTLSDLKCVNTITGHTGSVLCLQYNEKVIITGSSDATIRVWDIHTGDLLNTYVHHTNAVLHLKFDKGMLVTCSKDNMIAVWDLSNANELSMRQVLLGHTSAVNVVDFDDKYIVSASGDRTIKVWNTSNCEFVRSLKGHDRGIACLQYRDGLVVSGGSDRTIRLWNVETGKCIRVLHGHEELVRCLRFDSKRIVSGSYDGKILVWDLVAALDLNIPNKMLRLATMEEHTSKLFRLQFDDFQIVSSSHDDTIIIWDYLDYSPSASLPSNS